MKNNIPSTKNPLDAGLIEKFLDNQQTELQLRSKELDLQKINDQHSFEFSKTALEKETFDRAEQRKTFRECRKDGFFFISGLALLVTTVVIVAMWLGKDQIALEVLKDIIFLVSGGAGGYAIGKAKHDKTDDGA